MKLRLAFSCLAAAMLISCGSESTSAPEPAPDVTPEAPAQTERPNVLIVLWDTVRADHLSLYGYDKPTTPRLTEFAKQATVYEQAWSPGMWTLPSHASMFTGLPPTTHGAIASHRWLDGHHNTLAELLTDDGYDTFAFSSNIIASPMTDVLQGFTFVQTTYPRKGAKSARYVSAAKEAALAKMIATDASTEISPKFAGANDDKWEKSVYKDAAPVLHRGLVEWLEFRKTDGPWFAYLNMMEAHTPRIPSLESRKKVMTDEQIALSLKTDVSLFSENSWIVGQKQYTEAELAAIGGVYDAALIDLDTATGDLFDDLRERGVLENTVVIVVSDHGESLGEHRRLEHRWTIHEPLLHVPFLIHYPEKFPAKRVTAPVSTIDLFATVLDLTGVDVPDNPGIRSKSLVGETPSGPIYAELLDPFASQMNSIRKAYPDVQLEPWLRTYGTVRVGNEKYVQSSSGDHELFDLGTDPGELKNLLTERADRAKALEAQVGAWQAALVPYDASLRSGRDQKTQQTAEELELLKQLGYIDDGDQAPE